MRIDGQEISDDSFAEAFTRIHFLIEELLADGKLRAHPTYFDALPPWRLNASPANESNLASSKSVSAAASMPPTILHPVIPFITRIDFGPHREFSWATPFAKSQPKRPAS